MLKTLAVIAVILAVVVAGILIYAATKPDSFTVKRTASSRPHNTSAARLERARFSSASRVVVPAESPWRSCATLVW